MCLADGGARHVHGGVAGPDDGHALANLGGLGAHEVVQAKEDVAARLPRDAQRLGAPGARAHEDAVVAVAEEVGDGERRPDGGVVPDPDPEGLQDLLVAVEHALGQSVLGDAVAHDAAEAWVLVEDRDGDAHLREPHGCHNAGGPSADDGCALPGGFGLLDAQTLEVRARHVVLDGGEVDGRTLAAAHAVTLALGTVVADERAHGAHRVVLEEHRPGIVHPALAEQLDNQWDGSAHGAALLAEGPLAVEAALCLLDDVQCHGMLLSREEAPFLMLSSCDGQLAQHVEIAQNGYRRSAQSRRPYPALHLRKSIASNGGNGFLFGAGPVGCTRKQSATKRHGHGNVAAELQHGIGCTL